MATPNVPIEIPRNFFLKEVTFNVKDLFKAVAKGIGHTVAGKWEELASDTVESLSALGLKTEPEELGYLLLQRALTSTLFQLLGESSSELVAVDDATDADLLSQLEVASREDRLEISNRFLDRPLDSPLLERAHQWLRSWLSVHTRDKEAASAIVVRLPSYFVYAINNEWRKNAKSYAPLIEALNTPFMHAGEREWAWAAYTALLQKRLDEPIFDEPFGLRQLFVLPNAYYLEKPHDMSLADEIKKQSQTERRVVVALQDELLHWLINSDPEDSIRVLSGGPGSGKSSFSRVFAAKVAKETLIRVLFVPLHLIDPLKDLVDEIGRFTKEENILKQNPLDPESPEPTLLLLLDGLDELASQGKAAVAASRAFIREVERTLQRRRASPARLRVIISGRELAIQENESDFRKNRQILNILPYQVTAPRALPQSLQKDAIEYIDPAKLLTSDLRDEWWVNYGKLTGRPYDKLPAELRRPDLDEITAQPLLNYLVALSFTRGAIDFTSEINLNAIYADLLAAVYQRGYEKNRPYEPIRHLSAANFVRILEEIGLAAWHGDGRTTSVSEIEQHCQTSGIGPLLDVFNDGAKAGVTRLLAAFFFRQHGKRAGGDPTFVFTHKSFGEYLAARRIARAVLKISKQRAQRLEGPDEGWDEREALRHWIQIAGPTAITEYIQSFVRGEFTDEQLSSDSQIQLQHLFGFMLQYGMPMEQLNFPAFKTMLFHARNAEESLLVVLNICAVRTGKVSDIGAIEPTLFGAWYKRIQGQREGPQNTIAANCLSYLKLDGMYLDIGDFYATNLSSSSLQGVKGHYTNFSTANLTFADFSGSLLSWANFESATFENTNFRNTELVGANLKNVDRKSANFKGAKFADTDQHDLLKKIRRR